MERRAKCRICKELVNYKNPNDLGYHLILKHPGYSPVYFTSDETKSPNTNFFSNEHIALNKNKKEKQNFTKSYSNSKKSDQISIKTYKNLISSENTSTTNYSPSSVKTNTNSFPKKSYSDSKSVALKKKVEKNSLCEPRVEKSAPTLQDRLKSLLTLSTVSPVTLMTGSKNKRDSLKKRSSIYPRLCESIRRAANNHAIPQIVPEEQSGTSRNVCFQNNPQIYACRSHSKKDCDEDSCSESISEVSVCSSKIVIVDSSGSSCCERGCTKKNRSCTQCTSKCSTNTNNKSKCSKKKEPCSLCQDPCTRVVCRRVPCDSCEPCDPCQDHEHDPCESVHVIKGCRRKEIKVYNKKFDEGHTCPRKRKSSFFGRTPKITPTIKCKSSCTEKRNDICNRHCCEKKRSYCKPKTISVADERHEKQCVKRCIPDPCKQCSPDPCNLCDPCNPCDPCDLCDPCNPCRNSCRDPCSDSCMNSCTPCVPVQFSKKQVEKKQHCQKQESYIKLYETLVTSWSPANKKIKCPFCCRCMIPMLRKQRKKITKHSIAASLLLTCWPIVFLLPMSFTYQYKAFCACCNRPIGTYDKKTHSIKLFIPRNYN